MLKSGVGNEGSPLTVVKFNFFSYLTVLVFVCLVVLFWGSAILCPMSYLVTVEALIFFEVPLLFFSGESVHVHHIGVIPVTSGESWGICLLCLGLESHDSLFPGDYLLESPVLGVEFGSCIMPSTDHGGKQVLSKYLL